jgi:hypothetical protein
MKIQKIICCLILLALSGYITSCKNDKESSSDQKIVTERIQYDVLIKSPDAELEWYNQNLEGLKREDFVKTIMNAAYEGKVKAYDYYNVLLTPEEVKKIDHKSDTISVQSATAPYNTYDTVIKSDINLQQITKIRFLEEWRMDPKSFQIDKKVLGMMLMKENYGDSMELRGYSPVFWIYFDSKYPEALKLK